MEIQRYKVSPRFPLESRLSLFLSFFFSRENGSGSGTAQQKKRVESILDFQLICHLHSGTKCYIPGTNR